ncbi:MAG TPA: hypothetical protein VNA15_01420 [Candidatus Angelobacter sp.]|nr:hypothetical protein [Candidatus Angelobacter sp.]
MSNKDNVNNDSYLKTRGYAKGVGSLFSGIVVLLVAWILIAYFHDTLLQEYIARIIIPARSILGVTLIMAFGGFILSIPVLRSLSRREKASQISVEATPRCPRQRAHPLFMTLRPARDANFMIRKTSNRGRISRNRAGERLPPSYQEESP